MTQEQQDGFALGIVLVLMALLSVLLIGYSSLTSIELATTRATMNSFRGFYAAEAGLNARAHTILQGFVGGSSPTGTSPDPAASDPPCTGSNQGSGDFACTNYSFADRQVRTYVEEPALSSNPIVIPRGEIYQNLFGSENYFVAYSQAFNAENFPEALLEMHFRSRTVPLFQFAAFFNKDLEILPADSWLLQGPVHTNGDLYLGSNNTLDIAGQVTAAGSIYRGRKDVDTCLSGPVRVLDPASLTDLPACSSGRRSIAQSDVTAWDEMVNVGVEPLSVPGATILDPTAAQPYWSNADLRIVLDLNASPTIEVREPDGSVDAAKTSLLSTCGVTAASSALYNNREARTIDMLELDVQGLLSCSHLSGILGVNLTTQPDLDLVVHLSVDGPDSAIVNGYGVRLSNAAELTSILPAGPTNLLGATWVSDQAVYLQGDFNAVNKKPAAVLADTVNVLSGAWSDAASTSALSARVPTATTINAAFLSATDTTGLVDGVGGQDAGDYNGGLEGFIRLHEDWGGTVPLTYRGSFVSLGSPRHAAGVWVLGGTQYTAPVRDWAFDTDFEDPALLPPFSPTFGYLRQDLFVRRFEL